MALVILGTGWDDAQRGVETTETGISIRRWAVRFFPEINEKLPDNKGETIARAVSDKPSREITLEGEVTGTNGVMAYTFGAAITGLRNDTQWTGESTTGMFVMDEVTETQERAGWRSINMRISSNPQMV